MLRRLMKLIRGFLGLAVKDLEKSNPRAMIEAEKESFKKRLLQFNENLADHAGFIDQLMRQLMRLEQEERGLAVRVAARLKSGDRADAGQLALRLKTIKDQLTENRDQLTRSETTYKNLLATRDTAIRETREKIDKLKRLISETEMMETQAELQQMATSISGDLSGSQNALNRLERYLEERRAQAVGRSRVAQIPMVDMESVLEDPDETEQAEQALAEFEAVYGLEPQEPESPQDEDTAQDTRPLRELGPQSE